MTDTQWKKLELRIRQLLGERSIVQLVIIRQVDGTIQLQVTGDKVETLS